MNQDCNVSAALTNPWKKDVEEIHFTIYEMQTLI